MNYFWFYLCKQLPTSANKHFTDRFRAVQRSRVMKERKKKREWCLKEEIGSLHADTHTPERTSTDCVFMPKPVASMLMTGSIRSTFIPLSLKSSSLNILTWGVKNSYRRTQNHETTCNLLIPKKTAVYIRKTQSLLMLFFSSLPSKTCCEEIML